MTDMRVFSLKILIGFKYNKNRAKRKIILELEWRITMFFGKGKKEKKLELLDKKNIRLNCKKKEKNEVIREVGQMLYESGYVNEKYIEAMIKRELTFSTNVGNGIALPHGVEEAKKEVKQSGIAVMIFPEGTSWGNEDVKIVIGIAGVGEEHLTILSNVAEKLSTPEEVEKVVNSNVEEIYQLLTTNG